MYHRHWGLWSMACTVFVPWSIFLKFYRIFWYNRLSFLWNFVCCCRIFQFWAMPKCLQTFQCNHYSSLPWGWSFLTFQCLLTVVPPIFQSLSNLFISITYMYLIVFIWIIFNIYWCRQRFCFIWCFSFFPFMLCNILWCTTNLYLFWDLWSI